MLRPVTDEQSRSRLIGQICRVGDVTASDRTQMFELMCDHYENVRRDEFDLDFDEKDWVMVARNPRNGSICGFSTQVTYLQKIDGQSIRVLFSGDTIVQRLYWANNPLAQFWGQLALSLIDTYRQQPFYWFLISKGYKTYRFLPVFFREFFPRFEVTTPDWAAQLISEIAFARFGNRVDRGAGIVKAAVGGGRLRPSIADVTQDRLKNRHVAFFDRTNPGHACGDELCCIAPLTRENFNSKAYRVIGRPVDLREVVSVQATMGT